MLGRFSLATTGLTVGSIMTVSAIIAYIFENATINLIGFSYGIPILLGGIAFKITELKPLKASQPPTPEVVALREAQQTKTQKMVRKDLTRYWYGQDAHLDTALKKVGLGPPKDEQPVVTGFHEGIVDEAYALVLEFSSPGLSLDTWHLRQPKIERYFGPGIRTEITQTGEETIHLALITQPATVEEPVSV
ncbi:MAG: DUF2854 domain-containing protein [Thermosynechococcaceae cyanobacterium MS004]|nr:DUF2854 domain-containing protein [Thermosynechococcaceae cyanobacterium MS004]